MSIKDFKIISRLGEGSFASVWKVVRLSDNQEYALKKVNMKKLSDKEKENALNEVRILASIQSPFVIGYKEAFFDDDSMNLCIVMELATGGDIQSLIQKHIRSRTYIPEHEIWQFLIQILKGLKALHDKKIIHRDLKAANVFISLDGRAKIGDLNVSKVTSSNFAYTQAGTPYYASPEVWRGQPYDARSDIWSLGCIIYEMAALRPPFRARDLHELYTKVTKGVFDRIPYRYSFELSNIISSCLKLTPSQRPTTDQLLSHPSVLKYMQESQTVHHLDFGQSELIKTIKVPKNIRLLGMNLPKPNYNDFKSNVMKRIVESPSPRPQRPDVNKSNISDNEPEQKVFPFVRVHSAGNIQPQEVFVQQNFILQPPVRKNEEAARYDNIVKEPSYQRRRSLEREEEFLQRMRNEYAEYANKMRRVSPIRMVPSSEVSEISRISNNVLNAPQTKQSETREARVVTPERVIRVSNQNPEKTEVSSNIVNIPQVRQIDLRVLRHITPERQPETKQPEWQPESKQPESRGLRMVTPERQPEAKQIDLRALRHITPERQPETKQPESRGLRMITPERQPEMRGVQMITPERLQLITPERVRLATPEKVPNQISSHQREYSKLEEVKPSPRIIRIEELGLIGAQPRDNIYSRIEEVKPSPRILDKMGAQPKDNIYSKIEEMKPSPRVIKIENLSPRAMRIENPTKVQIDYLANLKKRNDPQLQQIRDRYLNKKVEQVILSQRKRLNIGPASESTEKNDVSQEYQPNEKLKKPYVQPYSRIQRK